MTFAVRTRVRYQETDQMGVVYHSNYLVYFELARTELMRACGTAYSDMEREGILMAVTRAEIEYLASARYDDLLRVEVRFHSARKASFRLDYEVFNDSDGKLLVRGMTELASLHRDGRPRRLPAGFTAMLTRSPEHCRELL